MGIVNRSLDVTQQKSVISELIQATTTAKSDAVCHFAQANLLASAKIRAVGLSGSATAQLQISRFVVGAGATLIPLGAALALVAFSTSGPQSYTFSNGASTAVQAGDVVVCTHAGTNAACEQVNVAIVIQATQDIKSYDL